MRTILLSLGVLLSTILLIVISIFLAETGIISGHLLTPFIVTSMVAPSIVGWILFDIYENSKVFEPLIKDQLKDEGYILISERLLTYKEVLNNLQIKPTLLINGTPVGYFGYKAKNARMLHVKTLEDKELLLYVFITKTWSDKIKLEIIKKTLLK